MQIKGAEASAKPGAIKKHACRRHGRCHPPRGNLGIFPASEAARKQLIRVRSKSKRCVKAVEYALYLLKAKNPESPAARREAFEDWGRKRQ
jgi:hypothetical protein